MTPKRVDRAARREDILGAAVRVFCRQGFAATRVEQIAAEAGIAKGSVYLYFDSREEILWAAADLFITQTGELMKQVAASEGPALERLDRLIRTAVSSLAEEPELSRVLLDVWSMSRRPAAGPAGATDAAETAGATGAADAPPSPPVDVGAMYAEYRGVFADVLGDAVREGSIPPGDAATRATVVVGTIEGCLLQALLDPHVSLPELAGPIADVVVGGLRAGASR